MNSREENISQNQSFGYVRLMHAVPDAPNVDIYANDNILATNLAYGTYTDYMMIPAGAYKIDIYATGTRENPVLSKMLVVGRNDITTAVAVGTLSTIGLLAIPDANVPSVADKALVRFVHLSPNAPAVDIALPDGTVLFRNVPFRNMTDYLPVDQMVYTLQVKVAGTDNVVLTVPGVDVKNDKYYTIYAIGLVGQQPALKALLLEDGVVSE